MNHTAVKTASGTKVHCLYGGTGSQTICGLHLKRFTTTDITKVFPSKQCSKCFGFSLNSINKTKQADGSWA